MVSLEAERNKTELLRKKLEQMRNKNKALKNEIAIQEAKLTLIKNN